MHVVPRAAPPSDGWQLAGPDRDNVQAEPVKTLQVLDAPNPVRGRRYPSIKREVSSRIALRRFGFPSGTAHLTHDVYPLWTG